MKHIKQQLLSLLFLAVSLTTFAQVGIGTSTPKGILELVSTDSGLIIPRVANTGVVNDPVNGMLIYDISAPCIKAYENLAWSGCLSALPSDPAVMTFNSVKAYNGVSVIDSLGVGYNGEAVPAASTIDINVTTALATYYSFLATDANSGLEYAATGSFDSPGTHDVSLKPNGVTIPATTYGVIRMTLRGASNTLELKPRIDIKSIPASETTVTDVVYGTQIWMDRNLGASRVATAISDVLAFGNYYQWGRPSDGHEIAVWHGTTKVGRGLGGTTTTLATTDAPGHSDFITTSTSPKDWRSDNNNNRWNTAPQGPCPTGYHVPTEAEWAVADAYDNGAATNGGPTVGWDNSKEAFDSDLKLPTASFRYPYGSFYKSDNLGRYWTSNQMSSSSTEVRIMQFRSDYLIFTKLDTKTDGRASGYSVRCIKD